MYVPEQTIHVNECLALAVRNVINLGNKRAATNLGIKQTHKICTHHDQL